ncbi:MAG TPA: FAD-dependent oxidoreductase [Candidatus Limnocylindrales bacterium]|nr:FAD-dependent oxidoreductase [Candidatus Limnocylindrales bacterium]
MAFVIVGASLAGANAAETLRAEGFTGEIVMVGEEAELPYERPPLSKGYLLGNQALEEAFVHPAEWYQSNEISLYLSTRATALDVEGKRLTLSSGEQLGYEKLLLATGARPRPFDVPGARYLRVVQDSRELKELLTPGRHVVIIGAGWIGLEVAAAGRTHGAQVTVVELDRLPLRRVLGDELAEFYRDVHVDKGVTFHFGHSITAADETSVTLDDGTVIPADVIVAGVGVAPNSELAEGAGLAVDNGIVVSESLETSAKDVFACGDVASWSHPSLGTHIRVEHWENARQSGMAAARAMLGQPVSYDWIPYFYSDQYDVGMEYSGYVGRDGYDSVVYRGDPQSREFIAFWVKDGRVLAGMNVNVWDVQDPIRALIKAGYEGKSVDLDRLADSDTPLEGLAS